MAYETGRQMSSWKAPHNSPRQHHWWRWILAGAIALIVVVVGAVGAFIKLQPTPSPLALPRGAARSPAGPLDGTWVPGTGSAAGFRVRESALGFSNDVVGRTSALTGTMVVSGDRVTTAMIRISLPAIKIGGKIQPQFARSLDAQAHPTATFTLAHPVALSPAFTSGAIITVTATGRLQMNGTSRQVSVTITCRRDGSAVQAAGSIPVAFSDWDIRAPAGFGFLGSLANHGVAEFLLVLRHSG